MPMPCLVPKHFRGSVGTRPWRKATRWAARIFVVVIGGALAAAGPLAGTALAEELPEGWINTPSGPLSPADRDMLIRVRLAGLWEIPAGELAGERGDSERVREVGAILKIDHLGLDEQVRLTAAKFDVSLPDEPNAQQREWLVELGASSGPEFDKLFADRLRSAHGDVFAKIATVRAGTRNEIIREFAQTGINVVMKHMTVLETTGIVNYSLLTPPPNPPLPRVAFQQRRDPGAVFVWVLLAAAGAAGLFGVLRLMRSR